MKIYQAHTVFTVAEDGPAIVLNRPELIAAYMAGAFDLNPEQESFWVIHLNRKNYAKGRQMITLGTATSCLAHPREIFRAACLASAAAIVIVHNHPSGDPSPSAADTMLTRQIQDAAKTLDIPLLDHVIIGDAKQDPLGKGYYSFREAGII